MGSGSIELAYFCFQRCFSGFLYVLQFSAASDGLDSGSELRLPSDAESQPVLVLHFGLTAALFSPFLFTVTCSYCFHNNLTLMTMLSNE